MSNVLAWYRRYHRVITVAVGLYCLLATVIILLNAASLDDLYADEAQQSVAVNDGWAVYEDGKLMGEELELPYHPSSSKVKQLVLQRQLPASGFDATALATHVYQNVLTVELDGSLLYQTPYRKNRLNHTPGSAQAVVPLPQGYAGKQLTLTYDRIVSADRTGATEILLLDLLSGDTLSLILDSNLFFAMCALIIVGLALVAAAVVYDRRKLLLRPLIYLASFAIVTPVWVLCNTKLIQFFTSNLVFVHNLEYICFFLLTLPVWAFLRTNWRNHPTETRLGLALMLAFYTLAVTLKVTSIADFYALNKLYHLLMLASAPLFIRSAMKAMRGHDLSLKLFFWGFILLALTGLADLVLFYILPGNRPMLLLWGVVAMGLCSICCYLISAKHRIEETVEDNLYKTLAYTDKLTGLPNRLTFEEDVEQLSAEISRHRSIIFINTDVNRFKQINDTYGHMMGDTVLRKVANVLRLSFEGVCKCYRMGGDEFCMIAVDQDPRQLDALLGKVNGELDRIIVEFSVSIAHGMAEYNSFLHHGLMDVFKSADDLMYEHKRRRTHR